jgi:hypothetical protein
LSSKILRKLLGKKGTLIKLKAVLYSKDTQYLKSVIDVDSSVVLLVDAVQKENWTNLRQKLDFYTLSSIQSPSDHSQERFYIKVFFNGQILWIKVREDDIIFL